MVFEQYGIVICMHLGYCEQKTDRMGSAIWKIEQIRNPEKEIQFLKECGGIKKVVKSTPFRLTHGENVGYSWGLRGYCVYAEIPKRTVLDVRPWRKRGDYDDIQPSMRIFSRR